MNVDLLDPADIELLELLARGWPTPRLAAELGLSPAAVRSRVRRVRATLGARTTTQAVVLAVRAGAI